MAGKTGAFRAQALVSRRRFDQRDGTEHDATDRTPLFALRSARSRWPQGQQQARAPGKGT